MFPRFLLTLSLSLKESSFDERSLIQIALLLRFPFDLHGEPYPGVLSDRYSPAPRNELFNRHTSFWGRR